MNKERSFKNISNTNVLRVESCGTPDKKFRNEL